MNKYNGLMKTHFKGCTLIGSLRDEYRDRTVNAYLLDGQDEFVGVSDGVESWIAPLHNCLKPLKLEAVVADLLAGKEVVVAPFRRRVELDPPARPRVRIQQQEEVSAVRRRLILE